MPPKVRGRSNNNNRKTATSASGVAIIKSTTSNTSGIATLKHYQSKADSMERRLRSAFGDTLTDEFATTMKKLVDNGSFYATRSISSFEDFLRSWYKSQIETGTSSGMINPRRRRAMSEEMFGTELTTAPEDYEKYGFLGSKDIDSAWAGRPGYGHGKGGQVMIEFDKDKLYGRATYTIGDSLDDYGAHVVPGLITRDSVSMTGTTSASRMRRVIAEAKSSSYNPTTVGRSVGTDPYIEIQLHGKITPDFTKSVTMNSATASRLSQRSKDIMRALGIKLIIKG